tara:strand:+ start:243 stop:725 length:483 start_codon:yes stop_codon:yes gene_type:complete
MRKYFKTTAMKKTIIILTAILFILTLSKKTSAKTKKYLLVDSKIKVNSKKNKVNSKDKKNIMIVLLSPDLSKDTLFTNKKGELRLILEFEFIYTLIYHKEGYAVKRVTIDTSLPKSHKKYQYELDLEIELLKNKKLIKPKLKKINMIVFNKTKKRFCKKI